MLDTFRSIRVSCPVPELLIGHVLGNGDHAVARHVNGCASCQTEAARLREAAGVLRSSAMLKPHRETADCPDEFALADFIDGRLAQEDRAPVVAHLLMCARCRTVVAAASSALADPAVTAAIPTSRPSRRWVLPIGAAAAAALVLTLWPGATPDQPSVDLRERTVTTTVAPQPISPRGLSDDPHQLVWSGVPHAERYRLRVYAADGSLLWSFDTADTLVALPDSARLTPGTVYFWKVEAQTEWKRWVASDLIEFRTRGSGR